MPAINIAFASLVYRYSQDDVPTIADRAHVWDSVPFNNECFMQLASLAEGTGLSEPPIGRVGKAISMEIRREWPNQVEGGINFLLHCDEQYREMTRDGRTRPTIEAVQEVILKRAPGRKDWEWLVSHTFNATGGLNDQLELIMRDHHCDAGTGYKHARWEAIQQVAEDKENCEGAVFKEGSVKMGNTYQPQWADNRIAVTVRIFGEAAYDSEMARSEPLR
ncbi:hypothetical protein FRC09_012832 [Ceratobasidium sp. 395]|nr:hypothetical protein FRC09_012832 [Ceratobasidium sp. 395]